MYVQVGRYLSYTGSSITLVDFFGAPTQILKPVFCWHQVGFWTESRVWTLGGKTHPLKKGENQEHSMGLRWQVLRYFTGFLSTRKLIHMIHSHGSYPQHYMFYIQSTWVPYSKEQPKNKQGTRRTALIQSWSSHFNSCFHHYMISQLINNQFLQA